MTRPIRDAAGTSPVPPSALGALRGTGAPLRAWQQAALKAYLARLGRDFLAVATPGAGKTRFALRAASELLLARAVDRVTVVTPTEHLKAQWAEAAHRAGIDLDPAVANGAGATAGAGTGVVVTYAQVAMAPLLHRRRTEARRSLVILDEVHHAGDTRSWGEGVREAFAPATRRLALTGTPFRSDVNPIPFVTYAPDGEGGTRSVADYSYGYAQALRDGVVRPVIFLAYGGQMRWRTSAGSELEASLGEPATPEQAAHAWRTALDPRGEWIPAVLAAADTRLTQVRRRGMPDAAGLVIASDRASARAYARLLRERSGSAPTVVLSDDPAASAKIAAFARSRDRWLVAVRMVSEGVDIPRLGVGVYATAAATPLFFAQAVGRFVRARRSGETASVFLPSVPTLLRLAGEIERERDHVLGRAGEAPEERLLAEARRRDAAGDDQLAFEPLDSSAALDRVLFDGGEFGLPAEAGSVAEQEFLGLPGLLEPEQVRSLLRRRQASQVSALARRSAPDRAPFAARAERRRELHALVAAWHHRTGLSHAAIHAELRRACGGPAVPQCSVEQLQARIEQLRDWAVRGRR